MALTKAQRSAAAKKAARTRKRNAGSTTAKRRTTRRRTTRKKGLLSMPSPAESRAAFKSLASGAVGGGLYLIYEDQVTLQDPTPEKKALFAGIGSYLLATMGGKPQVAAGAVGAAAYDFFKAKGLLDDPADVQMSRVQYADPLQNIPVQLSDDQMHLAQGGDNTYLAQEDFLQDGGPFNDYQPHYADTTNY